MLYTLDTNVISAVLNGNANVLNNISEAIKHGDTIMLNAICYYETKRGLTLPTFQRKLRLFESLLEVHEMLP